MLEYMKKKSYKEALEIAESIDWKNIKNGGVLCAVSEIYEQNGEFEKSREILFQAYERAPESKKVIYRLGTLALKLGDVEEAEDCFEEFLNVAPKDPNQHILKYKILRAKNAPIAEQIAALEDFKKVEYIEKWAFELAVLYKEAGMISECVEECDDLILWFSEGKHIKKAMELKMQYKPLTPLQQEKYDTFTAPVKEVEEKPVEEVIEETEPEVVEEVSEETEEVEEVEVVEEVAEESEPEVVEEVAEESEPEVEKLEEPSAPTMSVQEIVADWEEKQRENAQIIQAKLEEVQQEKAQMEAEAEEAQEEEEEILPEEIRQLIEELEGEDDLTPTWKTQVAAPQPVVTPVFETPVIEPTVEAVPEAVLTPVEETISRVVQALQGDIAPAEEVEEPVADTQETVVEEVTLDEEEDIKLGDTRAIEISAKALENAIQIDDIEKMSEEREEPKEKTTGSPYDTGFIVQGRYDLEAQSEVGLKAGLTEEQKKLFSYFVPVHGMSEQIVDVLQHDKECKARYGTSRIGNILIVGRKGSGKTVLAVNIIKAIQKARKMKQGKVAIVTAESLNKKDVSEILEKLHGGALVIEKASRLKRRTVEDLCEVMEGQTGELLVVLEDERKPMDKLLAAFPNFSKKFTSRVELPVFINDELVTFGQTYAKENGYKIDDMGILALYSNIDVLQREEKAVTVADVKDVVDDAITHAKKASMKKIMKKLFGKSKDDGNRVILTEEDFR